MIVHPLQWWKFLGSLNLFKPFSQGEFATPLSQSNEKFPDFIIFLFIVRATFTHVNTYIDIMLKMLL